jgi:hypothetical protein
MIATISKPVLINSRQIESGNVKFSGIMVRLSSIFQSRDV